jgi:hypothetical protein
MWSQDLGADVVVYDRTGSTNTPAYCIVAKRNGDVEFNCAENHARSLPPMQKSISSPVMVAKLFADLDKSWPITTAPKMVAKSASFGTRSYISYKGTHTADLQALFDDASAVQLDADFADLKKAVE